ncbi:MAG: 3,4-dihydroxy-2-butanone-4-phosphate synthase [Planctomycetota bacterium]|nr:3,4-dihydroxy-2-butanone-4-phosphate synthase [Planctomycetota bacterium]
MPFASVPEILKELRRGGMALLLDSREPDSLGDIICAAEKVTAKTLNFMASRARGLIRLSLPAKVCEDLQLEIQACDPEFPLQKAFTVSIDARGIQGPGISVKSRAETILAAIDPGCKASDLVRPGHVLPLRARTGGVLIRAGKTEGSMDLARLADLAPSGVMCDVLDTRGEQMRLNQLKRFGSKHKLKMCTIADIIEFRLGHEETIERIEDVEVRITFEEPREGTIFTMLISWAPLLVLVGLWIFIMRQMQTGGNRAMSFGKSKAKLLNSRGETIPRPPNRSFIRCRLYPRCLPVTSGI